MSQSSSFLPTNAALIVIDMQKGFNEPYWGRRNNPQAESNIARLLAARRRAARITTVVLVGLNTNHCVSTTTRMAGNLGFAAYVVSDATATFDMTGPTGIRHPAEEMHELGLTELHREFATVLDTESLLKLAEMPTAACP